MSLFSKTALNVLASPCLFTQHLFVVKRSYFFYNCDPSIHSCFIWLLNVPLSPWIAASFGVYLLVGAILIAFITAAECDMIYFLYTAKFLMAF